MGFPNCEFYAGFMQVWKSMLFFINFWKSLEKPQILKYFILLLFRGEQSDNFQKFSTALGILYIVQIPILSGKMIYIWDICLEN